VGRAYVVAKFEEVKVSKSRMKAAEDKDEIVGEAAGGSEDIDVNDGGDVEEVAEESSASGPAFAILFAGGGARLCTRNGVVGVAGDARPGIAREEETAEGLGSNSVPCGGKERLGR